MPAYSFFKQFQSARKTARINQVIGPYLILY